MEKKHILPNTKTKKKASVYTLLYNHLIALAHAKNKTSIRPHINRITQTEINLYMN